MSFGDFAIIYVEIGLVLALIEPIVWRIVKPGDFHDASSHFTGNFAYDCGVACGMIFGVVTVWPIHLITWYVIDPLYTKQKFKKES